MINRNDVENTIASFSKKDIIFQNEQQFQFELACEIKKKLSKNEEIIFEYVAYTSGKKKIKKYYIDLIIVNVVNGEYIPIELKYKTSEGKYTRFNSDIVLSGQGAEDLGRYDYLNDIKRIEDLKIKNKNYNYKYSNNLLKKYVTGFAIIISNEKKYWKTTKASLTTSKQKNYSYYDFCIGQGDKIKKGKPLKWKGNHNNKTFNSRPSFKLNSDYSFDWKTYKLIANSNESEFMYLITEIK